MVRVPEFLMGMAAGFLFIRSDRNPKLALPLVGIGLAGVVATTVASKFVPYLVVHTAMSGPAVAALVYGIALEPKWASWMNNRLFVLFGDASYSFYPLLSMLVAMFFFNFKTQQVRFNNLFGSVAWTVMMLALSSLVYCFIRSPTAQLASETEQRPAPVVASAVAD